MCGGGGGGDGGAADRKAAESGRQQAAIQRLNQAFGYGRSARPERGQFSREVAYTPQEIQASGGDQRFRQYVNNGMAGDGTAAELEAQFRATAPPATKSVIDEEAFNSAAAAYDSESALPSALDRRKGLYAKLADDSKQLQMKDLGLQRDVAQRETGFDLARRGLSGGSRQIDAEADIGTQFNKGVLQAQTQAQNIANTAEQADEKTRMNLINGIRGGMDEADAISGAMNGMSATAANAQNQSQNQEIGGFFDEIRAQAQQRQQTEQYGQAFRKYRSGSGGGSYNGNVSSV